MTICPALLLTIRPIDSKTDIIDSRLIFHNQVILTHGPVKDQILMHLDHLLVIICILDRFLIFLILGPQRQRDNLNRAHIWLTRILCFLRAWGFNKPREHCRWLKISSWNTNNYMGKTPKTLLSETHPSSKSQG